MEAFRSALALCCSGRAQGEDCVEQGLTAGSACLARLKGELRRGGALSELMSVGSCMAGLSGRLHCIWWAGMGRSIRRMTLASKPRGEFTRGNSMGLLCQR